MTRPVRILVIGQTPPPYHGQALMIERLVSASYTRVKIDHLRMSFSATQGEVGRFAFHKIVELVLLLIKAIVRLFRGYDLLYYPPAGPMLAPVLRDMALLPLLRLFGPPVVYHFRAGGVSEYLETFNRLFRFLARGAYGTPRAAIQLSVHNPSDGAWFRARKTLIIPNGIEDIAGPLIRPVISSTDPIRLLYVGLLCEEKGIFDLIEVMTLLLNLGVSACATLVGSFDSVHTRDRFQERLAASKAGMHVRLTGELTGNAKWEEFRNSDVLVFLTRYRAETFGNVVIEAMMCGLPVVANRWRGVQDIVLDGVTGFLVSPGEVSAAANHIQKMSENPSLAAELGKAGRERFESKYTLKSHLRAMEDAFVEIASMDDTPPNSPRELRFVQR